MHQKSRPNGYVKRNHTLGRTHVNPANPRRYLEACRLRAANVVASQSQQPPRSHDARSRTLAFFEDRDALRHDR